MPWGARHCGKRTPLAFLTPIADSWIVMLLSAVFLPAPLQELRQAGAKSAEASVEPVVQQRCQNAMAIELKAKGSSHVELAKITLGRTFTVVADVDPAAALSSVEVDR